MGKEVTGFLRRSSLFLLVRGPFASPHPPTALQGSMSGWEGKAGLLFFQDCTPSPLHRKEGLPLGWGCSVPRVRSVLLVVELQLDLVLDLVDEDLGQQDSHELHGEERAL